MCGTCLANEKKAAAAATMTKTATTTNTAQLETTPKVIQIEFVNLTLFLSNNFLIF